MSQQQIVYLNGEFIPRDQATVDIEDRGFQFGDGIYEVIRYYAGRGFLLDEHERRMRASLESIQVAVPDDVGRMEQISDELVRRNNLTDARVYWQITRGVMPRSHVITGEATPTVLAMASEEPALNSSKEVAAGHAILMPDIRWHHCAVKSVMLLPNSLAKTAAHQAGAVDAVLHRDGIVTEGASTSLFIVRDGQLATHPADHWILGGITRAMVIQLVRDNGIVCDEVKFRVDDLYEADEVFMTGTTTNITAITQVDDREINSARVGPMTQRVYQLLIEHILKWCNS